MRAFGNPVSQPFAPVFFIVQTDRFGYSVGIQNQYIAALKTQKMLVIPHPAEHSERQIAVLDEFVIAAGFDQQRRIMPGRCIGILRSW